MGSDGKGARIEDEKAIQNTAWKNTQEREKAFERAREVGSTAQWATSIRQAWESEQERKLAFGRAREVAELAKGAVTRVRQEFDAGGRVGQCVRSQSQVEEGPEWRTDLGEVW